MTKKAGKDFFSSLLLASDGSVPRPLLSRMNVFSIPAPDDDAKRIIAQAMYSETWREKEWAKRFAPTLGEPTLDKLMGFSPRKMRKAISAGFGNAHLDGRDHIAPKDIPDHALPGSRIGF